MDADASDVACKEGRFLEPSGCHFCHLILVVGVTFMGGLVGIDFGCHFTLRFVYVFFSFLFLSMFFMLFFNVF